MSRPDPRVTRISAGAALELPSAPLDPAPSASPRGGERSPHVGHRVGSSRNASFRAVLGTTARHPARSGCAMRSAGRRSATRRGLGSEVR